MCEKPDPWVLPQMLQGRSHRICIFTSFPVESDKHEIVGNKKGSHIWQVCCHLTWADETTSANVCCNIGRILSRTNRSSGTMGVGEDACARDWNSSKRWGGVCEGHKTALPFNKVPQSILYSLFLSSYKHPPLSRPKSPHLAKTPQVVRRGKRKRYLPGHASCAKVKTALYPITLERCC